MKCPPKVGYKTFGGHFMTRQQGQILYAVLRNLLVSEIQEQSAVCPKEILAFQQFDLPVHQRKIYGRITHQTMIGIITVDRVGNNLFPTGEIA